MALECQNLICWVSVQEISALGNVVKSVQYKNTTLSLGRDEYNEVILKLFAGKRDVTYMLRNIQVHKKFFKDGKATIKILDQSLQLMLSNCPPDKLVLFLKTMMTKLECKKKSGFISNREKIKTGLKRSFQEISPLTLKDLKFAKGLPINDNDKCLDSTPKSKRQHCESDKENQPQMKQYREIQLSKQRILQPFKLTKEQRKVLDIVINGENVFFTGSLPGKASLAKYIVGALPPDHTFATASTGVAACYIGGITLHAFAGIGSGNGPLEQCVQLANRPSVKQNWMKCHHLIIDEVSMVHRDYFDKLEAIARLIRRNDKPFGGIQVIVCGDFLQLPPVTKKADKKKFCFQSPAWRKCINVNLELTEIKRQDDPKFIDILQNIRKGLCPGYVNDALQNTVNSHSQQNGIEATRLCTHKDDVNYINLNHLAKLKGDCHVFTATCNSEYVSEGDHCPVEPKLKLKIGTQVMLTKNLDLQRGLVNGARGVVCSFDKGNEGWPHVKFLSGTVECVRPLRWVIKSSSIVTVWKQLPLKLAWAISIHKSQGMTLDFVEISLSRVFEAGQAYVALSRAKSLKGLRVLDFDHSCVRADPDVLNFYNRLKISHPTEQMSSDNFS
ncbi:ATP-dependent DNA helicase PIF1 [Octopus bimaculoides]|uniref:ATP-dependent DNA helicase PIF1 n=1 Tax=Octopus bimaculoides TaxID=37653 RepID=UPI00071D3A00|nr:ATP-dependent DNA helicase PIF1 [Octopus bimaculoides]|eukprot:XP_014774888.1 PREDICTED: ATP-dependent DNA helicase PIF1-like [Octopus bimaculoides]